MGNNNKPPPSPAYILGVGLTKFVKPRGKIDYTELGFEAGIKALLDASINYDDVDQGIACYCYGDSACGQRVFYQFGMTKIPIYNVNNNCSTGSTGLNMARQAVSFGAKDCVLVVGFEKMFPGSLKNYFTDREVPTGTTVEMMKEVRGITNAPGAAQMFGNAGREYMEKAGMERSLGILRRLRASIMLILRRTHIPSSGMYTRWTRFWSRRWCTIL